MYCLRASEVELLPVMPDAHDLPCVLRMLGAVAVDPLEFVPHVHGENGPDLDVFEQILNAHAEAVLEPWVERQHGDVDHRLAAVVVDLAVHGGAQLLHGAAMLLQYALPSLVQCHQLRSPP